MTIILLILHYAIQDAEPQLEQHQFPPEGPLAIEIACDLLTPQDIHRSLLCDTAQQPDPPETNLISSLESASLTFFKLIFIFKKLNG